MEKDVVNYFLDYIYTDWQKIAVNRFLDYIYRLANK